MRSVVMKWDEIVNFNSVLWLVGACVVGVVTAVPASIDGQSEDTVGEYQAMQDQNVMLRCRASGVPAPSVRWNKDGTPVNQTDPRYRLLRSGWLAIAVVRYVATPSENK